jgi:4-diphosphocytidyl-2-C-methyl-D-erythritol kinase
MTPIRTQAFAKVNLSLLLGGARSDGRHELVTAIESVDLADELVMTPADGDRDEVICAGVSGPNLVAEAIASLRATGWGAPPLHIEIEKRIPVAAGMGGGSADAAALLRAAPALAPVSREVIDEVAAGLGSDVPSQLDPGPSLAVGAGDLVRAVPELDTHAFVVVPQPFELSTADVYREADRLGRHRGEAELAGLKLELESFLAVSGSILPPELVVNDLAPASLSLRPEVSAALEAVTDAGATNSLVCGSGPTVIGVFWGAAASGNAAAARDRLRDRYPLAVAARPVKRGVEGSTANP